MQGLDLNMLGQCLLEEAMIDDDADDDGHAPVRIERGWCGGGMDGIIELKAR